MESLESRGYTIQNQLSKGQYTSVLTAHSTIHQSKVAVKLLASTDVKCSLVRNAVLGGEWMIDLPTEVHIHKSLKHENIVALLTHHLIDRSIAVVLEFCDNGSLRQLLSKTVGGLLTEPVSRRYFAQMFSAINYLHSNCIVHRDISVDKFLLDARDRIKLSNFGTAMSYNAGDAYFTTRQGSPGYWPPEVLEHRPFNPRTADVWALGVSLHVLLTSRLPFGGDTDVSVDEDRALAMMRHGLDLSPSGPSRSVRLSTPVIELLRGLLHYVTEVRFTLNRIRSCDWVNCRVGPMLRDTVPPALNKPYIGNFYLVAKPHKYKDSPLEKVLKENFDI